MKLLSVASRIGALSLVFAGSSLMAQDAELDSDAGKAGYSIGVNIGMNLVNQMPMDDINAASLIQGISDAIRGELQMSEEEIMTALQAFSIAQQEKMAAQDAAAAQEGRDFLAQNGQRPEVTTTASGLQYEVLEQGAAGGPMPSSSPQRKLLQPVRCPLHGLEVLRLQRARFLGRTRPRSQGH